MRELLATVSSALHAGCSRRGNLWQLLETANASTSSKVNFLKGRRQEDRLVQKVCLAVSSEPVEETTHLISPLADQKREELGLELFFHLAKG